MKERPILFSGPMVRAILEGRNTMTRRVVKPQPANDSIFWEPEWHTGPSFVSSPLDNVRTVWKPPFGVPGDRLWVREAWRASSAHDGLPPRDIPVGDGVEYLADVSDRLAGRLTGRYRHARFAR